MCVFAIIVSCVANNTLLLWMIVKRNGCSNAMISCERPLFSLCEFASFGLMRRSVFDSLHNLSCAHVLLVENNIHLDLGFCKVHDKL